MTDEWYAPFLCYAKKFGLVNGYPDGSFRPASNINFVEAAKILAQAFELNIVTTVPTCENADPLTCPWFRPYVLLLEARGAIPTSIVRFDQSVTRGEMAEMIYRLKIDMGDKPTQTYEFLSLMKHCDEWLAKGGKNCE